MLKILSKNIIKKNIIRFIFIIVNKYKNNEAAMTDN